MSDEPEDWQYGPEIASDLRDFINLNKDIDKYQKELSVILDSVGELKKVNTEIENAQKNLSNVEEGIKNILETKKGEPRKQISKANKLSYDIKNNVL